MFERVLSSYEIASRLATVITKVIYCMPLSASDTKDNSDFSKSSTEYTFIVSLSRFKNSEGTMSSKTFSQLEQKAY